MKRQKNITIALIALLVQFAFLVLPILLNISISHTFAMILFWIPGVVAISYALISLVRSEATAGIGILSIEVLFAFWTIMSRSGGL